MLLIPCPWCGERDESEFHCGGQSHIARPTNAETLSDAEGADYLYMRDNPRGLLCERWHHSSGCRRWFNVARDTVTHEIHAVYRMTDPKPDIGNS